MESTDGKYRWEVQMESTDGKYNWKVQMESTEQYNWKPRQ
jgi:hypothetical protein